MTDNLTELLARRADRAPVPGDPGSVVTAITARAAMHDRRRRNRVTIASGAALVAVVASVAVVVSSSDGTSPTHRPDAGGAPSGTVSSSSTAPTTTLVPVGPAPAAAEISLGLVPKGFQYLAHDTASTFYGTPGTTDKGYYSDGIVVDVHAFMGDTEGYTLTVDGKAASYVTQDGYTVVRVRYSATIDVGFQAPPAAGLTKAQALQMAATLDVRSTAQQTKG